MIKVSTTGASSAGRALFGLACLAVAGVAVSGCGSTAGAAAPANPVAATTSAAATNTATTTNAGAADAGTTTGALPASAAPAGSAQSAPQPTKQGSGTSNGAQSPGTRCHTQDVSASFTVVPDSPAAGNISYNLRLTNTSARQCTIYGFAGMLLLDAKRAALPTHVEWDSLVPKQLVRLTPGGSAAATVRFSPDVPGVGDNQSSKCEPTSYYVEVTPPDETTQDVTAVTPPTSVCERGTMAVSAFVAGRTGPNQ